MQQNQLSAHSAPPVIAISPLDALAAELGAAAARIEQDLRRDLAIGLAEIQQGFAVRTAEIQQELETVRRHSAEVEARAVNAEMRLVTAERALSESVRERISNIDMRVGITERALTESVNERLATVRDGTSITIDDVRPLIDAEVARQIDAAPKPPDGMAVQAGIAAEVEYRINDIAKRSAELIPPPAPLPDVATIVAGEMEFQESAILEALTERTTSIIQDNVIRAVSAEVELRLDEIARRAVEMAPTVEPLQMPDVAAAVSDEFDRREGVIADRVATLAYVDVTPSVTAEVAKRIDDIARKAAALVPALEIPDVGVLVDHAIAAAFATIPLPQDGLPGEPGISGKDADPVDHDQIMRALIDMPEALDAAVERHLIAHPIPQGEKGERGDPGESIIGPQGEKGDVGELGAQGDPGPTGERGETGQEGQVGPRGETGADGAPGEVGPQGERGETGQEGDPGERGNPGPMGERGETGASIVGPQGDPGQPGASIVGPQGVKGDPGESIIGPQGERGERGERGEAGPQGEHGLPGESVRGDPGPAGESVVGPQGEKGERGDPGLLPLARTWTDTVHYESDVVIHAGATWQAMRATGREPPHEDWICLASAGCDGRSFQVRGTYDAEIGDYRALDVVALDGSSFVARKDDPGQCPGDGWQLLSPRGKPGKPGDRGTGIKGDRGPPGLGVTNASIDDDAVLIIMNADGSSASCDLYPILSKIGN